MAEIVRIAGVELPNKPIAVALTYIRGIGSTSAVKILEIVKVDPHKRAKMLTEEEIKRIRGEAESGKYLLEGELRQKTATDIRILKEIKCYRGIRHLKGLPVRGQRTRTNCRTRKGKSLPVGGLKHKLEKT
jgi:small subunit ribosomal protein S13